MVVFPRGSIGARRPNLSECLRDDVVGALVCGRAAAVGADCPLIRAVVTAVELVCGRAAAMGAGLDSSLRSE